MRKKLRIHPIHAIDSIPNTAPESLAVIGELTLAENQPLGTLVGEFNASDPDTSSTLVYHFVSGIRMRIIHSSPSIVMVRYPQMSPLIMRLMRRVT